MTLSLAKIEEAEFGLVDRLSRIPYTDPARPPLEQALIDLRIAKRKMLEADGSTLRKSTNSQPNGRRDLPANDTAVKAMVAEARDRQSEEQRLGLDHRDDVPSVDALAAIKSARRMPIAGDRGVVGFLNRNTRA